MGEGAEGVLALDVVAGDGVALAGPGAVLGPALFAGARAAGAQARLPRVRLGGTALLDDLRAVTREPLYAVVFEDAGRVEALGALLAAVELPALLLQDLMRLKGIDGYTYRHVLMTTVLSAFMLQDLGLPAAEVSAGACAALTHDLGKLTVPLPVLRKEGALTAPEALLLRQHPAAGCLLLHYYLGADSTHARVALGHHERPDGSGYPAGLRLTDRLVCLIAVSDIFDALISPRPYRPEAYGVRGALEFLWAEAQAGRVEEGACRLLISYNRRDKPDPSTLQVSAGARSSPPSRNRYGTIRQP